MTKAGPLATALLLVSATAASASTSAIAANACGARAGSAIAVRDARAPSGSAFADSVRNLDAEAREAAIRRELVAGNVPDFLRRLAPVRLRADAHEALVCVMPDYLAIGSDEDYLLVPMRLSTALAFAGRYGFVLPTRKLVDAIYAQSRVRLQPQPLPPGPEMVSTAYYEWHNALVQAQRAALTEPLGMLTAGDKKDLVITPRFWSKLQRVAIYGWHRGVGEPIQPLSTVHGRRYADYSHGARLIAANAYVDGVERPIVEILRDPQLSPLFSDEGALPRLPQLLALLSGPDVALGRAP